MQRSPARCSWALGKNEVYLRYHDEEWGVPLWDDQRQFEFLILEGAQAGLSWSTILNKRDGYRHAFDNFDAERVAAYTEKDIERLVGDSGIVRNRLKIQAAIGNARAYLALRRTEGDFCDYLWSFVGGRPIQNHWRDSSEVPVTSAESDALSKDLKKRGFRFVGSTIIYAHMQATGMVNDHLVSCFRHTECAALASRNRQAAQ